MRLLLFALEAAGLKAEGELVVSGCEAKVATMAAAEVEETASLGGEAGIVSFCSIGLEKKGFQVP